MQDSPLNNLDLSLIAPGKAAMYSANLWHFLGAHRAVARFGTGLRQHDDGTVWLGYIHEGVFCGTRLAHVLTDGAAAGTGCYAGLARKLQPLENFWPGYIQLGRCFFDPGHSQDFGDLRWREGGDHRTCLWCGHTQHQHRWIEHVQHDPWRPAAVAGAITA